MVDIESRLQNASENIKVSFVDPAIVLNKAKIRKEKQKNVKKKNGFTLSFVALALCAFVAIVVIPATKLMNILSAPGKSGDVNSGERTPMNNNTSKDAEETQQSEGKIYDKNLKRLSAPIGQFTAQDETEGLNDLIKNINTFSTSLFSNISVTNRKKVNTSFSPASLYCSLSILSKTMDSDKNDALFDILGTSQEELDKCFPSLIRSCNRKFMQDDNCVGREVINNSIWLDNNHYYDENVLKQLSENYYTSSYWGDFSTDNDLMNKSIKEYIYDVSEGLFNPSIQFPKTTSLVLLNGLYFDDQWNELNNSLTPAGLHEFHNVDGTTKSIPFYSTHKTNAKIMETEKYKSMYVETLNGFTIDFLVPKDGYDADDLYTSDVLLEHENQTYVEFDSEGACESKIIFPEFTAGYQGNLLKPILDTFNLSKLDGFSNFATNKNTGEKDFEVSSIVHATKINIKSEDSGANSVNVIVSDGESKEIETEVIKSDIKYDLIVDRPFVYVIKDSIGTTLFNGTIYNV